MKYSCLSGSHHCNRLLWQISVFQSAVVFAGQFESKKDTIKYAIAGFSIHCLAMLTSYFCILSYYPGIGASKLPTRAVVSFFTGALGLAMSLAYNFILLMSFITTEDSLIFGGQAHYAPVVTQKIKNETACRSIIVLVHLVSSSALATLGLDGILTSVNTLQFQPESADLVDSHCASRSVLYPEGTSNPGTIC